MARKKKIEYHSYYEGTVRYMSCMTCGRYEAVGESATGVRCSRCVNMMMMNNYPLETKPSYMPTGRPPGWHFMKEFVDKDGNVFHRGKEVPKLKGTLSATKVKPLKKRKINISKKIDKEVLNMKSLLDSKNIPDYTAGCKFCDYSFGDCILIFTF